MLDFADARRTMVDCQLRPVEVTHPDVLAAMLDVPRERFVPPAQVALAFADSHVPLLAAPGRPVRSLTKPEVFARLVQAAAVAADERVLVVGCASGYAAAVLARLGRDVIAVEEDAELAATAEKNLAGLATGNVKVVRGPLVSGWPAAAPYDVIFVDGAIEVEPTALLAQLAEGGRLVAIQGRGGAGKAMVYRLDRGDVSAVATFNGGAPVLPGFEKSAEFVF
ncbi:protein-L-isoaspartate O-methyltransferase [Xanthobacteraceae bacterium Astr-EGSB]|uniref:protein-L-isoaspartate O-methyltransferase family protein n=1 Tax=Astrobacterium formosum TaxID=3069710 RepID=UPI0027B41A8E|nr:protein-L-isoaspartate O-methyltransferase [Xanthobacteraceae bacterium Astr-EGSB]